MNTFSRRWSCLALVMAAPCLELGAADFVVSSEADDGPGSLRRCIEDANATAGLDLIRFNLPPEARRIVPSSPLPPLLDPVTIDATTQPGFVDRPVVEISGENLVSPEEGHGFLVFSGHCTVRGLVLNLFPGAGITIVEGGTNVIEGCSIGMDFAGSEARPNLSGGLYITSANNRIGGDQPGAGNLISGNENGGLILDGENATNNVVLGNQIGLSKGGDRRIGNMVAGILINDSSQNQIGGVNTGHRNIISGNDNWGLFINGTNARHNRVQGNYVGVDPTGQLAGFGNTDGGVVILDAPENEIGGFEAGAGNVVSGNDEVGIKIKGGDASRNRIRGNLVGLASDGAQPLGNGDHGIYILDSPTNDVGGSSPMERNVISANVGAGVKTENAGARGNRIRGNWIGIDASGQLARPNGSHGIIAGTPDTIVGGREPGEGNVLSGNRGAGLQLTSSIGLKAVVMGNRIGTDPAGMKGIPNSLQGVFADGVSHALIGGSDPGQGNLIAGNVKSGITLIECADVQIHGNQIGVLADGATPLGNGEDGIRIRGSTRIQVGRRTPFGGNLIAHSPRAGISLESDTPPHRLASESCTFAANSIHDNVGLAIDLRADGSTPNDPLDADAGPNGLQNTPTLDRAYSAGGHLVVDGTLVSAPNTDCWIDLYLGLSCTDSTRPEARRYLGATKLRTSADGFARFHVVFSGADADTGQSVASTATDDAGNTSELSPCVAIGTGLLMAVRLVRDDEPAKVELRWQDPSGNAVLEQSDTVGAAAAWTEVATKPVVDGDERLVRLPFENTARFFRLRP